MPEKRRRYCLISPTRDEAEFARRTLDSVCAQSEPPARWVIVDDGSTDDTPAILAEYAAKFDFIQIVTRVNRGERKVGPGVIDAFYAGYETIDPAEFGYVCKIDLDLDLPPKYFATLMDRMEADPRLGTCSGKAYYPASSNAEKSFDGELISEACGDEMSVGMIKFYRTDCFADIGGFVRQVMWDGIDCHRCRMNGWRACSWDDPELRFLHLRPMGSSHKGIFTGRMRHGFGQWFMGTSLPFMTASAVFRMTRPPVVLGGLAMWWGYVRAMLTRQPRYDDPEFRRFLRRYQWSALRRGKAAATGAIDERNQERFGGGAVGQHETHPPASGEPGALRLGAEHG
ncbi:MAG: glycosyltransferase family 2 protein [Planctomycetota bacterium]